MLKGHNKSSTLFYQMNAPELQEQYDSMGFNILEHISDEELQKTDVGFTARTVVDYGCGSGRDCLTLTDLYPNVVGYEPCNQMMELTAKKLMNQRRKVYLVSDIDGLARIAQDFPVGCYVSIGVFQHLSPKERLETFKFMIDNSVNDAEINVSMRLTPYGEGDYRRVFGHTEMDQLKLIDQLTDYVRGRPYELKFTTKRTGENRKKEHVIGNNPKDGSVKWYNIRINKIKRGG